MGVLEEQQVADQRWRALVDERLKEHNERLDEHLERLDTGDERMTTIEGKIDDNTQITADGKAVAERVKADTDMIVGWVKNITGFNNVVSWLVALLVKTSIVIVAAGIVHWFITTGQLPKKVEGQPAQHQVAIATLEP